MSVENSALLFFDFAFELLARLIYETLELVDDNRKEVSQSFPASDIADRTVNQSCIYVIHAYSLVVEP